MRSRGLEGSADLSDRLKLSCIRREGSISKYNALNRKRSQDPGIQRCCKAKGTTYRDLVVG